MYKTELSYIIVNYNGKAFLKNCIDSIVSHSNEINYEIILVDNQSNDGSLSDIENLQAPIKIIRNTANLGFAKANNQGVKNSSGAFVLLLNNDTLLTQSLKPAIELLKTNDSIGALGIKMLDGTNNYRLSAGNFPTPWRLLKLKRLMRSSGDFFSGQFPSPIQYQEVDWIEGSFILTTKNIWDQIGGLDESFFMYAEDVDFCKRISNFGKKTVYLPSLTFIHFGGFTSNRNDLLKKGLFIYLEKHFSGINKLLGYFALELNYFVKKHVKKNI